MSESSYSTILRNLSKEYSQKHIGFEEYRARRKIILDKIDKEFNGRKLSEAEADRLDDPSDFMKTIAFFKDTEINE